MFFAKQGEVALSLLWPEARQGCLGVLGSGHIPCLSQGEEREIQHLLWDFLGTITG